MEHRAPSRSPAVSNSGFSDFDAPSESFPRSAPLRNAPKIVHVDVDDIGGENPAKKRSLHWSGLFNIFLMIGICIVGGALYAKVKEANENEKEATALKSELERMKKSQHLQTLPKGMCDCGDCGDERRKLDENKRKIDQLEKEIDVLKKERSHNEQTISKLDMQVDQKVADLSLKERENEELKNTIKDLEAKLSKKDEKAAAPDDIDPGSCQESDETSKKFIQDLKEMLINSAREKIDEERISQLRDFSRESYATEKTDEERISQLRDLRNRFLQMRPIDAESEASTRCPYSQAATPFSPADSSFRKSFPSSQELRLGSPSPPPEAMSHPAPFNAPFNALLQQELQGEILSFQ